MSERTKNPNTRKWAMRAAKGAGAVAGALMAGATVVGCSPNTAPVPTITVTKTVEAPGSKTATGAVDTGVIKLTSAQCDIEFKDPTDNKECKLSITAAQEALAGNVSKALTDVSNVDYDGKYNRINARDVVEPAIAQYAAQEAKGGNKAVAQEDVDNIDYDGKYTRIDAQKTLDAVK